jgi:hypothetical protein
MKTTGTLSGADIESLVGTAILAPSVLNTQPWRFRAGGDVIDVHLDPGRTLPGLDPSGRAAVISCSAAVLNLRLAVLAAGLEPVVELLPDLEDELHLARVRLTRNGEMTAADRILYEAIPRRHTNRLPFTGERLPAETVAHLEQAADAEGGLLRVLTGWEVPDVVRTVHEADSVQRDDPQIRAEVGRWINRHPDDPEGITT